MEFSRRRIWMSTLALAGVSAVAIAQSPIRVSKGADNSVVLQFHKIRPAWVEVVVEGEVIATRTVEQSAQQVTLAISSWGLAPGTHEATIKVYDAQGRLIGQTRAPIEIQPDPNAPITLIIPRNRTQVSGVVPIEVRLNPAGNQYVTFFVNGQVRALRNYPPYVYHWDTTAEPNGWHTLEAWSFNGNQTFRTPITRVFVNNPGGRTERQLPAQSDEQIGFNEPTLAPFIAEAEPQGLPFRSAPSEGTVATNPRLSLPHDVPPEKVATEAVPEKVAPADTVASEPQVRMPQEVSSIGSPQWRHSEAGGQLTEAMRLTTPTEVGDPSLSHTRHTPTATPPGVRLSQATPLMRGQKLHTPQEWVSATLGAGSATPAVSGTMVLSRGMALPAPVRTFEVVLNDRLVVSDVAPQVENGLPLVTLRHPMEQAGAEVEWSHELRVATVRFAGRELKVEVDAKRVMLDGREVRLEAPPRIVRGRILLPPWVLCEMLNADLLYDSTRNQLIFVPRMESSLAEP